MFIFKLYESSHFLILLLVVPTLITRYPCMGLMTNLAHLNTYDWIWKLVL